MARKVAELVVQGDKIKELRTPPHWPFLLEVQTLADVYDKRRHTHTVPDGQIMALLECANTHFKLVVKRKLCNACWWFGKPTEGESKCGSRCAHLGQGGDLFLLGSQRVGA